MHNIPLNITSIGNNGDGISNYNQKKVYVPYSCTGDVIEAKIEAEFSDYINASISNIQSPSHHRETPPCEYYEKCGGCKLQHLNEETYKKFKSDILSNILTSLQIKDTIIEPLFVVPQYSRRRVELKVSTNKANVSLGFFAPFSHNVINIESCLIADKDINYLIPKLKTALESLKKPSIITSINITSLEDGLDVILNTRSKLNDNENNIFNKLAEATQIVRLTIRPENTEEQTIYNIEKSYVEFGDININIPTGAFLQASRESQKVLADFAIKNLKNSSKVADLYSGCGTFSFPLAKHANFVGSYEGSDTMVSAIYNSSILHGLDNKINATKRDLFKKPLSPNELQNYDAVIINPPRNGALPQIKNISKSNIKKLVMVSCNPKTFRRDAHDLIKNKFKLRSIQAIDQFLYSPHLEIAACFIR